MARRPKDPARTANRGRSLPRLHRILLRSAARWVPRLQREAWLREWRAEMEWAWTGLDDGPPNRARAFRLLLRACWAHVDALWIRTEEISMSRLQADLRLALRNLRHSPGFTLVAVVTLALGIGANTGIFSIVNGVLLKPLPYPDAERLVSVNMSAPGIGYPIVPFSEGFYFLTQEHQNSFAPLGMYNRDSVNLVGEGPPERLAGARVTPSVLEAMGVAPTHGRLFLPEDSEPGAEPVAILADELWRTRFGGDPELIGQVVELDGVMRRIVGIMPPEFAFPSTSTRVWKPFPLDESNAEAGSFSYPGIARLKPGVTIEGAREDLAAMLARLSELMPDEFPPSVLEEARFEPRIVPLAEAVVGDIREALWIVLGTVGFLLLIACANVANLFLVRAEGRHREVTLRAALGAGRGDIARLFLTESLLLALVGGAVGVGLAMLGLRLFQAFAPVAIPRAEAISIDSSVLGFTVGISIFAGLLFGLVPVLRARAEDLATALREGGPTATASGRALDTRNVLVVAQVSLALVLLVGSGLMARSFQQLRGIDPGFDPEGVLTLQVALPAAEYPTPTERVAFWRQVLDRVRALPGVTEVGAIDNLPVDNARSAGSLEIEDHPFADDEIGPRAEKKRVLPGFFETLGVQLREGRSLREGDSAIGTRAVVVSESFARRWWPDESPLGKRLQDTSGDDWWEIVGVVGNVHFESLEAPAEETVYYPALAKSATAPEMPALLSLTLKTTGDPRDRVDAVRRAVWDVDPRQPITNVRPMEQILEDSLARTSFTLVMLGLASAMALLLGAVGIYGVISYLVAQRTAEIGVRIALGAPGAAVRRMVVGRALGLAAIGIGVGLVAALGLSRVLASLLYEVSTLDPVTYIGVTATIALTALTSAWIPARRASRVDPREALRTE